MRRGQSIALRHSIFIGVEGESDRAFVRFLWMLCERQGRRLHLKIKPAHGGDSVVVVESAVHYLSRASSGKEYKKRIVLLDEDRIPQDRRSRRDAYSLARRHKIEIIVQRPNLEGLLVRLHRGHERRQLQAIDTKAELKKLWPGYDKSINSENLNQRFTRNDVLRAARHDAHFRTLLKILGLA